MGQDQHRRLGNYEILEKIGQGGMGAVYKARQVSIGRVVALKILPPRLAKDEQYVGRFLREARSAGVCSHPNLILVHDAGEAEGYYYFSMEFVDGESLGERLKRDGPLDPDRAVAYMLGIAGALREAHRKGIVHRDVKPDNILVGPDDEPKLADLGLAKPMSGEADVTLGGNALGTPLYMSPEQAKGEAVDGRADLYGLGASFWHLIAGEALFTGPTVAAITIKHVNEAPRDLSQVRTGIDARLAGIFAQLLEKNPDFRYQDADALIADLTAYQRGADLAPARTVLTAAGVPAVASRRAPRWPWVGAAVLVLTALGIGAGLAANGLPDGSSAPDNDTTTAVPEPNDEEPRPDPDAADVPDDEGSDAVVPTDDTRERAEELLERADAFWRENPTAYDRAIRGFERARQAGRHTSIAGRAGERIREIRDSARDRFRLMAKEAKAKCQEGDFDGAMAVSTRGSRSLRAVIARELETLQSMIRDEALTELARRQAAVVVALELDDADLAADQLAALDALRFKTGLYWIQEDRDRYEERYQALRDAERQALARRWRDEADDMVAALAAGEEDAVAGRLRSLRETTEDPAALDWLDAAEAVLSALRDHRRAIIADVAERAGETWDFSWREGDGEVAVTNGEVVGARMFQGRLIIEAEVAIGQGNTITPKIPWDRLPPAQRRPFDRSWRPGSAHDRVALAVEALRAGAPRAALDAVAAAADHPLAASIRSAARPR